MYMQALGYDLNLGMLIEQEIWFHLILLNIILYDLIWFIEFIVWNFGYFLFNGIDKSLYTYNQLKYV